jgi:hypothetical protein
MVCPDFYDFIPIESSAWVSAKGDTGRLCNKLQDTV